MNELVNSNLLIYLYCILEGDTTMYWDTLTATGVFVSIVSTVVAFYLVVRVRPVIRREDMKET